MTSSASSSARSPALASERRTPLARQVLERALAIDARTGDRRATGLAHFMLARIYMASHADARAIEAARLAYAELAGSADPSHVHAREVIEACGLRP